MATWNHIDHGEEQPEDSVFRYDLDPWSGLERTELVGGKEAEAMKQRICSAPDASLRDWRAGKTRCSASRR